MKNNNQSTIVIDRTSVVVWKNGREIFKMSDWPSFEVNLKSVLEDGFSVEALEKIKLLSKFANFVWVLVLSNIDSASEKNEIVGIWRRLLYSLEIKVKDFLVVSDLDLIVWSGSETGEGVGLIVDIDSRALGRVKNKELVTVGGMSCLMASEGSEFALGWKALRIITKMADGRLVKSGFYKKVMDKFGFKNVVDLKNYLLSSDNIKDDVALVAPIVLENASMGDSLLEEIVISELEELVIMVETVNNKLMSKNLLPVFVSGDLFVNHFYFSNFERLLHEKFSNQEVKLVSKLDGVFNLLSSHNN